MKANDFITIIGDMLGEDFTYNVTWTRSALLGYLRKTLRRFAEATLMADNDSLRIVNSTTGESTVPADFVNTYHTMYNSKQVDLVQFGELDFVSASWTTGVTASVPLACTIMGSGADSIVRVVPVPASTLGPFGEDPTQSVILSDGVGMWALSVGIDGVISTAAVGAGVPVSLVLSGPSVLWEITVNNVGVLSSTLTIGAADTFLILTDTNSIPWTVTVTDAGVILATSGLYGKITRMLVDNVAQDFTSDYGIVVDAYAQSSAVTPSAVVRLTQPFGTTTTAIVSTTALHLWYKSLIDDVPNYEHEIYLMDCYLPIIQHGVLALAYNHDGDGRDVKKAQVMELIFKVECESLRRMFNQR